VYRRRAPVNKALKDLETIGPSPVAYADIQILSYSTPMRSPGSP
jgi:hypothetical protein